MKSTLLVDPQRITQTPLIINSAAHHRNKKETKHTWETRRRNLIGITRIKPRNFLRHMWRSSRAFDLISTVNKMDDSST
jgi:hypothetical protein